MIIFVLQIWSHIKWLLKKPPNLNTFPLVFSTKHLLYCIQRVWERILNALKAIVRMFVQFTYEICK